MTEDVAELPPKDTTTGLNSVWDIARNQEYNRFSYWGPVALLEATASDRAGYYCGGSTFVTTPHEFPRELRGRNVCGYQGECDESVLQVTIVLRTLHLSQFSPLGDYQACVKGNL
jgi:hypothetical protein